MAGWTHWRRSAILVTGLLLLLCPSAVPVRAQPLEASYNPRPAKDDVVLPMPGGYKMVFVRVPIAGRGYWGGAERILEIGSDKQNPEPFEANRTVRIGGNFKTSEGAWFLVFGKYEVTIGQYAALMGGGDIAKGLTTLAQNSSIDLKGVEASPAGNRMLARPLHGMNVHEYQEFIDAYNTWCLGNAECVGTMRRELGVVGFMRLPTEPEWEYVARGGPKGAQKGSLLPFPSADIAKFANVDNAKATLPDEIGRRNPSPNVPVYDLFGNVAELMANPFTMDNGMGSVGANVVRGGDYTTPAAHLRFSSREELPPYFFRSSDSAYVKTRNKQVGIRLMIGTAVKDFRDRGATLAEMEKEFRCCYVPIVGAGSGARIAGKTLATAKNLGTLVAHEDVPIADSVGGDQTVGYFSLTNAQFGRLRIELSASLGDLLVEIKHGTWERSRTVEVKAGATSTQTFEKLLPGPMWIKFFPAKGGETVGYQAKLMWDVVDIAGNRTADARDLGVLTSRQIDLADYVGAGDTVDFFKFRVERADAISIRLLDLTGDANVELLAEDQTKLAESINSRTTNEEIDYPNAVPGTYYIRVYSKDESPATYRLVVSLGAVDTAGDTFAAARDLGTLESTVVTIREHLSATDRWDYYKLTIKQTSSIVAQISQMTANADVYLANGEEKFLIGSSHPGTQAESIDTAQPAGTYYVAVRNATTDDTPYLLTIEVRPAGPYSHIALAYELTVGSGPATFRGAVSETLQTQWVKFKLNSPQLTKIEVKGSTSTKTSLRFAAVGDKRTFGPFVAGPGQTGTIVEKLQPAEYYVFVQRASAGTADVRVEVTTSASAFMPQPPGDLAGKIDDWQVGIDNSADKKRCFAYTVAKSISPEGWRVELPMMLLAISHQEARVYTTLDKVRYYDKTEKFKATARGGGINQSIGTSVDGDIDVKPAEPCPKKQSGFCLMPATVHAMNKAEELVLEGKTSDRKSTYVRYSLHGYKGAIQEMNRLCDNAKGTGWLVEQR
jgi:hypothetical protein